MPINEKHKVLFIHIPKTAGSSMEVFFNMQQKERFFSKVPTDIIDTIEYAPQHFTAEIMKDKFKHFDQYFKFAFVRNPYDRLLSEYYYIHKKKKIEFFNDILAFEKWIFNYLAELKNCYCHKIEQYRYVYDRKGNNMVDFVGKFENLQEDFSKVLKMMNYPGYGKLVKFQSSKFEKNKRLLTDMAKYRIRDVYYKDFKLFGYEF